MSTRLCSPTAIGDILSRDPDVLARVVLLSAEVRRRQKAYFADRGAGGGRALDLLRASKEHERLLDLAIDGVCRPKDLLG